MGKHRISVSQTEAKNQKSAVPMKLAPLSSKISRKGLELVKYCFHRDHWHAADLPHIPIPESTSSAPKSVLENVFEYAKSLLETETAAYNATHLQSSSSHKFMSTIMSSGTWSDKVSALTLLVQESPLHTTKSFENLLGLSAKHSRTQALMALGALKDLLGQGVVLPGNRKLRTFTKQPGLVAGFRRVETWSAKDLLPNGIEKVHLITWAYEDWLKGMYFEMLKVLERWCNDEVEFARVRAVTYVWELLKEKPEQEENLLRLLVNKLGDTSKKIASRASHLLLQLQVTHPSMKSVIVNAVESEVLLRPGQSSHAKYYAVITLNQTILRTSDPDVANKLLDVYFSLFITILNRTKHDNLGKGGESQSKKRKRSTPATPANEEKSEQELEDKIIAQVLTGINRAFPFSKTDGGTFERHLDTMFRITHSSNFNTSVQALLLIQKISATHHISTDRFLRTLYESLLDPRLLKSSKQTMYLNLLYRSLKADVSVRRVQAFVKRLLQIITLHEPAFICAVLYLINELQTIFPSIKTMLDQPEAGYEDDEEVFHDVPEISEALSTASPQPTKNTTSTPTTLPQIKPNQTYDGRKRDPDYSNASLTCLWDLVPWPTHYHPSVSLFATTLLHPSSARSTPPKPDLASHTLMHFLDRFAYRNAKMRGDGTKGTSLMQPALGSRDTTDTLFGRSSVGAGDGVEPVNTEAFWKKRSEEVAVDEVFFHNYFSAVGPRKRDRKAAREDGGRRKGGDDDEEDGESADEEEIWKALVGSRQELDEGSDVDTDEEEDDDVELDMDGEEDDDDIESLPDGLDGNGIFEDDDDDDGEVELNLESDNEEPLFSSEGEAEPAVREPEPAVREPEPAVREPEPALPASAKTNEKGERRRKKTQLSNLPTFASAEDYAKLLDADEESADGGE